MSEQTLIRVAIGVGGLGFLALMSYAVILQVRIFTAF